MAGIYIPLAVVTAIILVEAILRKAGHQGHFPFILLCVLVIAWYASDIAGKLSESEDATKLFWNITLVFVGFVPPVLLLFVLDFYRASLTRTAKFVPLIFVIPCLNTVMALTANYHELMYTQLDIVSLSPVQEIVRVWGPWFWVHTVFCYAISILVIIVIFLQHFRKPKFYRLPSSLMISGIYFTLAGNVITLLQILPPATDPTLVGTSLALIFFNFAIINNDKSNFIRYSTRMVYDYLDIFILVMDERNHLVHANKPALDWFSSQGIALKSLTINEVVVELIDIGATQRDAGTGEEVDEGTDFYIPAVPLPVVLNLHVREMTDKNGDKIGSVAIFTDVTQNRLLIKRLEEKAGVDSLTGIPNRTAYEGARCRFDSPEHLPLSVIMCDLNGLKAINDNFGHHYGDMALQVVAEVFEEACPPTGFIARIGGDEYVFLLPCSTYEDASALVEIIRGLISSRENLPFSLSVALGAATKQSADENYIDVVNVADKRMYENKKRLGCRR